MANPNDIEFKNQLNDFLKVKEGKMTKSDIMKKYNICATSYRNYKKRYVVRYGVDPRLLYRDADILNSAVLSKYVSPKELEEMRNNRDNNNRPSKNYTNSVEPVVDDSLYLVKGKSTLYDEEGNVKLTWVKQSLDDEAYYKGLKDAIFKLTEGVKPAPEIINYEMCDEDLMTFIPIPDLHLGMYIDGKEVSHGIDWDLETAEKYFYSSMNFLINHSPKSSQCVIYDTGDILHVDNDNNRTARSGHALSTSDRYSKVMLKLFEILINSITLALNKFETVYFHSVKGNHNDNISIILKCVLANHFRNNPRVKIDIDTYKATVYHKFGKNLIGMSHGHMTKPEKSLEVMTADNLKDLSSFTNFDFYFGHFHQEKSFQLGMINVHLLKPIIPCEAWADGMGYRGEAGYSKAIIYHKEYGPVSTITHRYGLQK